MSPRRTLRDEDLDAVIGAVLRATQAFVGLALQSLTAAGASITLPQYRMLAVLAGDDGQNVRDLAARLGVERSTATRMWLIENGKAVRDWSEVTIAAMPCVSSRPLTTSASMSDGVRKMTTNSMNVWRVATPPPAPPRAARS